MNVRTKKILRDVWLNKARSVLIILAVAIGVAAFGLMLTGRMVLEENLHDVYAHTNPAHVTINLSPFDDELLTLLSESNSIDSLQALRVDSARVQSDENHWLSFEIRTISDFDSIVVNTLTSENEIKTPSLNTIYLEQSLKNVIPIDHEITIELLNGDLHTLKVAGFVNDLSNLPSEISLTGIGYISLETAQELGFDNAYNQILIRFKNTNTRTEIEKENTQLIKQIEDEGYFVINTFIPQPNQYVLGGNMSSVLFILNSLGVLTLILSAFLVTSVMSAVMSQQIPQIGILKSLGARISQTMSLYFQEVLLFGIIALILAIPMGLIGAYFLADGVATGMNFKVTQFHLPIQTLILQAFSALLAPLLASLFPIISGSRITIREAISNYKPENTKNANRLGDLPQLVNLSIRNTFRRKGRLLLTFFALLLAGAMFIAIIGIRQSMRNAVAELQGDLNYDISFDFAQLYSKDDIENETKKISEITTTETWAINDARLVINNEHESGSIIIYGVPQNTNMAQPAVIHGTWLQQNISHGIFVNADFMDLSPNLKIGSVIKLNITGKQEEWTILGSTGRGFIPTAYVFYDDLTEQTGFDNLVNRLVIQTGKSDSVSQSLIQSDVLSRLADSGYDVINSQTTTQLKETTAAQMDILIILLLAMVILISVVGGLGLAITMSLNVIERTREIGILRSLGAQNGVVRRVVIIEGLAIGLISWAISIPCSIPLAIWLGNSLGNSLLARPLDYIFSIPAILTWLGLTVVISIIASILPAQSAAKLTIRDALVYE